MKLSKLVNEVNQEQELLQLCDKLVADLLEEHLKQYPTLTEYSYEYKVSRKYIKIISLLYIECCFFSYTGFFYTLLLGVFYD